MVATFDEEPRVRPKKDRTRWCGGHVGREHTWGPWERLQFRPGGIRFKAYRRRVCSTCGKKSPIKSRKDIQ